MLYVCGYCNNPISLVHRGLRKGDDDYEAYCGCVEPDCSCPWRWNMLLEGLWL